MKIPTICTAPKRGRRFPNEPLPLFIVCVLCSLWRWQASSEPTVTSVFADAFVVPSVATRNTITSGHPPEDTIFGITKVEHKGPHDLSALSLFGNDDNESTESSESKFDMAQRIESLKSVVLGALSGGIAVTPIAYLHYVTFSEVANTAQWEFTTDMSSLEAALFAIVYRYAVRANDNNPMLNQGVVGAFVVVRTLANIQVTSSCLSVPLRCK